MDLRKESLLKELKIQVLRVFNKKRFILLNPRQKMNVLVKKNLLSSLPNKFFCDFFKQS